MKNNEIGWIISAGNLELVINREHGCVCGATVINGDRKQWMSYEGDVTVRDELIGRTFGKAQLENISFDEKEYSLTIHKTFKGAPWKLTECYSLDSDSIAWKASVTLENGDYRTCAISWNLPWPQPVFPIKLWTANDKMPEDLCRFAGTAIEYGEATSGTTMPVLSCYRQDIDAGILIVKPFDFDTPRFRFLAAFRELDLRTEFDWLALSPKHTPKARLLFAGTAGHWRPALGWIFKHYVDYFEPVSKNIRDLWGGHICGTLDLDPDTAKKMKELGIKWYEIHCHFPAYGNYHPEGVTEWMCGHNKKDKKPITVERIRSVIKMLQDEGIAAMPYIQVAGDGDQELLAPEMYSACVTNRRGERWCSWPGAWLMDPLPNLPFGKDIDRQIDGLCGRYPEMDGVFLDQPCYNFIDTAHDDGITAIDNKPATMTGLHYKTHIERLARHIHPDKTIIGNGPFGISVTKHMDGFMAEGSSWLCDHLQYYAIGTKPLFFLMYNCDDASIELMFQSALLHGAGFASYPKAYPSKDLFDKYMPLLEKLYRRRWIFDKDPIQLPVGFKGNIFRGSNERTLYVALVRGMSRIPRENAVEGKVIVKTKDIATAKGCTIYRPGIPAEPLPYDMTEEGALTFTPPTDTVAALIEIDTPNFAMPV